MKFHGQTLIIIKLINPKMTSTQLWVEECSKRKKHGQLFQTLNRDLEKILQFWLSTRKTVQDTNTVSHTHMTHTAAYRLITFIYVSLFLGWRSNSLTKSQAKQTIIHGIIYTMKKRVCVCTTQSNSAKDEGQNTMNSPVRQPAHRCHGDDLQSEPA